MKEPLVSVLMTAYNREKYIAEAIESVIAQTYQNWELIITDDKSKDNTLRIAQKYANKDKRIKVYLNERNLGDYPNRNRAASWASGKYLKYLDADDLLYPWALDVMVSSIEQYPEAGWGVSVPTNYKKALPLLLTPNELFNADYLGELPILSRSPLTVIIKKVAFDSLGGFTGKQHIGDFEMWNLLGFQFPVVIIAGGLAWWRRHDDQQSKDNRINPFVNFKYPVCAIEMLNRKDCPINKDLKAIAVHTHHKTISRTIIKSILRLELRTAQKMMRYSNLNVIKLFLYAI